MKRFPIRKPKIRLSVLLDILLSRSSRVIGRSEVALMERANLFLGECSNDSMQDSTIVEENEILRVPDAYKH